MKKDVEQFIRLVDEQMKGVYKNIDFESIEKELQKCSSYKFSESEKGNGVEGVIVVIECLYISICLPSLSKITVKLSNPFTIPLN